MIFTRSGSTLTLAGGLDHFRHGLHARPHAREAAHGQGVQAQVQNFLHAAGEEHRRAAGLEDVVALVRSGAALGHVVVARNRDHAAVLGRAGHVGVLEHVRAAVHPRALAVPDAEHAVVPLVGDRSSCCVPHTAVAPSSSLTPGWKTMWFSARCSGRPQRLVVGAQRAAAVATDEARRVQPRPPHRAGAAAWAGAPGACTPLMKARPSARVYLSSRVTVSRAWRIDRGKGAFMAVSRGGMGDPTTALWAAAGVEIDGLKTVSKAGVPDMCFRFYAVFTLDLEGSFLKLHKHEQFRQYDPRHLARIAGRRPPDECRTGPARGPGRPRRAGAGCGRWKKPVSLKGYRAEIDRHKIGLGALAFVRLDADRSTGNLTRAMEEAIRQIPEVVACHYISGTGTFELQGGGTRPGQLLAVRARRAAEPAQREGHAHRASRWARSRPAGRCRWRTSRR